MYMTRREIFDQIWTVTVQGFAEEHELNYARLLKVLKAADIPKPSRRDILVIRKSRDGWRQLRRPELPGDPDREVELPRLRSAEFLPGERAEMRQKRAQRRQEQSEAEAGDEVPRELIDYERHPRWKTLSFLPEQQRRKVIRETEEIRIVKKQDLHPKVLEFRREISVWQAQLEILGSETLVEEVTKRPAMMERVSIASLDRVLLILDCLYCSAEYLGATVMENGSIFLEGQEVELKFSESRSREPAGPDDPSPGHVYRYNGRLSLNIGYLYSIRDRKRDCIEDRLGEALELLYLTAFQLSLAQHREQEARQEEEASYNREMEQTEALVQKARDYEDAVRVRELIRAVQKKLSGEELQFQENFPAWAAWASEKADWLDPTVGREDAVLGRRHAPILHTAKGDS